MKISYFSGKLNFGDILNLSIFSEIFNVKDIEQANGIYDADIIAIGSLMESLFYKDDKISKWGKVKRKIKCYKYKKIRVFGTGFISPQSNTKILKRRIDVVGLRGEITKKRLSKITGNDYSDVVLGDPGLLSSFLISQKSSKNFDLGIIPHYTDSKSPLINELHNAIPNSTIIDIQQQPISFLNKLNQCRFILSSAMHGLIAADSLRIPNKRLIISDYITGGDYKFDDYYSSFGHNSHPKLDFRKKMPNELSTTVKDLIDNINNDYKISNEKIEEKKSLLYNTFSEKIDNG